MWAPFYRASFVRPIRENLRILLETNEAASLAWANGGQAMDAYRVHPYRKALWYNTLWPIMSVVSQTSHIVTSGDESRLDEVHSILVEVENAGPDPDQLAEDIERRVQAADAVIRSAPPNVLRTGMDEHAIMVTDIEISPHDYTQFTRGAGQSMIYLQAGSLIVTVATVER